MCQVQGSFRQPHHNVPITETPTHFIIDNVPHSVNKRRLFCATTLKVHGMQNYSWNGTNQEDPEFPMKILCALGLTETESRGLFVTIAMTVCSGVRTNDIRKCGTRGLFPQENLVVFY